jgi:hypothetical protein
MCEALVCSTMTTFAVLLSSFFFLSFISSAIVVTLALRRYSDACQMNFGTATNLFVALCRMLF